MGTAAAYAAAYIPLGSRPAVVGGGRGGGGGSGMELRLEALPVALLVAGVAMVCLGVGCLLQRSVTRAVGGKEEGARRGAPCRRASAVSINGAYGGAARAPRPPPACAFTASAASAAGGASRVPTHMGSPDMVPHGLPPPSGGLGGGQQQHAAGPGAFAGGRHDGARERAAAILMDVASRMHHGEPGRPPPLPATASSFLYPGRRGRPGAGRFSALSTRDDDEAEEMAF